MLGIDVLRRLLEKNPYATDMGIELIESGEGYALARVPLAKRFTNFYGGMHGGCSYSLGDTVAGLAATSFGHYVTTVDGHMNYLLPVRNTEYVYCEAECVRQGNSIGVYDVKITDDSGKLLCKGDYTYYQMQRELYPEDIDES